MNHSLSFAAFGLLLLPAPAQDQASTLYLASQRAAVVVRATVFAATDPSPQWHRLQFRTLEVLKGTVGAEFELLEPAGACCGRSLFALQIGESRLLFLLRRSSTLHPFAGSRGVLPDHLDVIAHVRALLQLPSDNERAALLAASLASAEPRIAEDAAHALAVLPQLALASQGRDAVLTALRLAVQRGQTSTAPLVDVFVRVHDATMLDAVLPTFLTTPRSDQARLLQLGLSRCDAATVVERLPLHLGTDEQAAVRAAQLLAELPADDARVGLQNMLARTQSPRVQLRLAEGLLAAGVRGGQLAALMPAPVLELAERRQQRPGGFRSISPNRQ